MKILVTGAKGQLGSDVVNAAKRRGHEVCGVDINEIDITDNEAVTAVLIEAKPDVIMHCAAWTAVDAAEDNEKQVRAVNVMGTDNIAKICKKLDSKLIYISTDYVFNGQGTEPWKPDDKCEPINVYGRSKYDGELAASAQVDKLFIIRVAWVFGKNGNNFIKTMLNFAKTRDKLTIVNDQIGTPTYTVDLARLLVDMAESELYGTYHATNEGGFISWYDFAVEIFKQTNININIEPINSDRFPTKAIRPKNSKLDKIKLAECGFEPLSDWRDALSRYLKEIE